MELLGGAFGTGKVSFHATSREFLIQPDKIFALPITVGIHQIADIQQISADSAKKVAETAGLGAAGLLLGAAVGPLSALAGLTAGVLAGGKRDFIAFSCKLRDGRAFYAKASVKEFAELEPHAPRAANKALKPKRQAKHSHGETGSSNDAGSQNHKQKSAVISGRRNAKAPPPTSKIAGEIAKLREEAEEETSRSSLDSIWNEITALHTTKWRYYDQGISDEESKEMIFWSLAGNRYLAKFYVDSAETYEQLAESTKQRALEASPSSGILKIFTNSARGDALSAEVGEFQAQAERHRKTAKYFQLISSAIEQVARKYTTEDEIDSRVAIYSKLTNFILTAAKAITIIERYNVNIAQGATPEVGAAVPAPLIGPINAEERLRVLGELREKNLITQEEYDERRALVLSSL